jgi:adenosylmethionine-8-amino-7-oxononanoate aminotransferase
MSYNIWHPYTQMQTAGVPINIVRGEGAYIYDDTGRKYIDAVASWWTNLHGHAHPHIANAIAKQAHTLEQVIFAGFTHPSDNGSTAVEVAIKMSLQYFWNKGEDRKRIIAFRDAYHGDTFGSMSISARGVFTAPFQSYLFDVDFIDTPTKHNADDVKQQLHSAISNQTAAFIFEPLVLGSAGMLMYDADVLDDLIGICKENGVLVIADEVMTGFGRTGQFLATDYCSNKADMVCLSKGITGGFLPFAATTCTQQIYDAFLSDERAKMLFHGHSYTGNALGCAAGLASLEVFEMDNTWQHITRIVAQHSAFAASIANHTSVTDVRQTGTILAIELKTDAGYLSSIRDKAYNYFIERGILIRPLGNIIYLLPPYCISKEDLEYIYAVMLQFFDSLVYGNS